PPRGGHPDAGLATRPGAEQLQAMLDGRTPAPPLSRLTGMRLVEFAPGTATFTLPLSPWLADASGVIPLGPLTMPADAAMACAIIAGLPAGTGLTTSELGLRHVRPLRPGGSVRAHGRMLDPGPPVALAEVTVTDEDGRLIAHGGSLCVTLPRLAAPEEADGDDAAGDAAEGRDPWERPLTPGHALPPLGRLTGLRAVAAARGEATFVLPATRWLCAPPPGRVQGGAVATLADAAITAAIRTAEPGADRFAPVELHLNFLRPLASDGRDARADGRLLRAGRRTAVASAEVLDADGRVIAVATGSAVAGAP
ncbi:MAG TPA: PaaI family thioesterase, partial [Streptosporangiaceae bacterium]|nr:PaaI family thioesterase [Streptosporangiaceae bacterium]